MFGLWGGRAQPGKSGKWRRPARAPGPPSSQRSRWPLIGGAGEWESPGVLSGSEGRNAGFWRVVLTPHLGAPGSSCIRASSQRSGDRGERRRANLFWALSLSCTDSPASITSNARGSEPRDLFSVPPNLGFS